jgi:hypothetical protein
VAFGKGFTSFGALWSMPTSTDPGNVYFRDPPGGATTDSTPAFAAASRAEQVGDRPEAKPAAESEKPALSLDLRPFVPVALDNPGFELTSSNEHYVLQGAAADQLSEANDGSLGADGLDGMFSQEGLDI